MLNYWEWQEREGDAMESERRRDERARFEPSKPIDDFASWRKWALADTMADAPMTERQMREIYSEAKRTDNAILFGLLRRYVRLVSVDNRSEVSQQTHASRKLIESQITESTQ